MPRSVKLLNTLLFPEYFCTGKDGLSMDRCYNGTAAARGMDPSLSTTCSWVLPYKRRPLDKLGRGHEGNLVTNYVYMVYCVSKWGFTFPYKNWQVGRP